MWAHRALPLKNQLSIADAQAVEAAFEARLSELGDSGPAPLLESEKASDDCQPQRTERGADAVTVISKPVRDRDRAHLKFVAAQPCLVCGRTPSDPHHVKFAVPICRLHHRELHRRGNERVWWQNQGIDPLVVAATLWARTHTVGPADAEIVVDTDRSAGTNPKLNGCHFGTGAAAGADRRQNNETKPIRGPEAE